MVGLKHGILIEKLPMHILCAVIDYCNVILQPENLLLDAYGNLKISDFGLSALSQQVRVMTICFHKYFTVPRSGFIFS